MHIILQLITYVKDSQKLFEDLLIVLQIIDCCQLPVFLFLILLTGSLVQYKTLPKTTLLFRKKLILKHGSSLTKGLFECFSNGR